MLRMRSYTPNKWDMVLAFRQTSQETPPDFPLSLRLPRLLATLPRLLARLGSSPLCEPRLPPLQRPRLRPCSLAFLLCSGAPAVLPAIFTASAAVLPAIFTASAAAALPAILTFVAAGIPAFAAAAGLPAGSGYTSAADWLESDASASASDMASGCSAGSAAPPKAAGAGRHEQHARLWQPGYDDCSGRLWATSSWAGFHAPGPHVLAHAGFNLNHAPGSIVPAWWLQSQCWAHDHERCSHAGWASRLHAHLVRSAHHGFASSIHSTSTRTRTHQTSSSLRLSNCGLLETRTQVSTL